jgi:hypothetical protein
MRTLLTVKMDTEKANQKIQDKELTEFMQANIARLEPEAAYFTATNGYRTVYIVFDLKEPAQMPSVTEPFFLELGAEVTFQPVMTAEDVMRGLSPDYTA